MKSGVWPKLTISYSERGGKEKNKIRASANNASRDNYAEAEGGCISHSRDGGKNDHRNNDDSFTSSCGPIYLKTRSSVRTVGYCFASAGSMLKKLCDWQQLKLCDSKSTSCLITETNR